MLKPLLYGLLATVAVASKDTPFTVSMITDWGRLPPILSVAELVSEYGANGAAPDTSNGLFWRFLSKLGAASSSSGEPGGLLHLSDAEQMSIAVAAAKEVAGSDAIADVISLSVSSSMYLPKIEMFRSLSADSRAAIGSESLSKACASSSSETFVYVQGSAGDGGGVVLCTVTAVQDAFLTLNAPSSSSSLSEGGGGVKSLLLKDLSDEKAGVAASDAVIAYPLTEGGAAIEHAMSSRSEAGKDGGDDGAVVVTAFLYGQAGSATFTAYHEALTTAVKEAASNDLVGVRYVLRHSGNAGASADSFAGACMASGGDSAAASSSGGTRIQGYGVELIMRNMEYKTLNDLKVLDTKKNKGGEGKADDGDGGVDDEEEEVDEEGFMFKTLERKRPDLKIGLDRFRKDLIQNVSIAEGMKEWFFKDLGVQASQLLGRSHHPLTTIADMSQDFPVRAYPLTKISVNTTLKKALKATQSRYGQGEFGVQSFILLNGRRVEIDSNLGPFTLTAAVTVEMRRVEALHNAMVPTGLLTKAFKTTTDAAAAAAEAAAAASAESGGSNPQAVASQGSASALAMATFASLPLDSEDALVDVTPSTMWLNNLESDAPGNWYRSVQKLVTQGADSGIPFVAKNLFNSIAMLNPVSKVGGTETMIDALRTHIGWNAPLRFGVSLVCPPVLLTASDGTTINGGDDPLCVRVVRLASMANDKHGPDVAVKVVSKVLERIDTIRGLDDGGAEMAQPPPSDGGASAADSVGRSSGDGSSNPRYEAVDQCYVDTVHGGSHSGSEEEARVEATAANDAAVGYTSTMTRECVRMGRDVHITLPNVILNGHVTNVQSHSAQSSMANMAGTRIPHALHLVREGIITDTSDPMAAMMSQPGVFDVFHSDVFPAAASGGAGGRGGSSDEDGGGKKKKGPAIFVPYPKELLSVSGAGAAEPKSAFLGCKSVSPLVSHLPVYGGSGGTTFNDVDSLGLASKRPGGDKFRMQALVVRHTDGSVQGVEAQYARVDYGSRGDGDSDNEEVNIVNLPGPAHGATSEAVDGDMKEQTIVFGDGETISHITGRQGGLLDALTIHTTAGRKFDFGNTAGEGGSVFSSPHPLRAGETVIGIHGRAGDGLDSLGLVTVYAPPRPSDLVSTVSHTLFINPSNPTHLRYAAKAMARQEVCDTAGAAGLGRLLLSPSVRSSAASQLLISLSDTDLLKDETADPATVEGGMAVTPAARAAVLERWARELDSRMAHSSASDESAGANLESLSLTVQEMLSITSTALQPFLGQTGRDAEKLLKAEVPLFGGSKGVEPESLAEAMYSLYVDSIAPAAALSGGAGGLGSLTLYSNGRVIHIADDDDTMGPGSLSKVPVGGPGALLRAVSLYEGSRSQHVVKALDLHRGGGGQTPSVSDVDSDVIIAVIAALMSTGGSEGGGEGRHFIPDTLPSVWQHAAVDLADSSGGGGATPGSALKVQAVLDPLSGAAQKAAPLLLWLQRSVKGLSVQVFLNPVPQLSDFPIKSFYRYAMPHSDSLFQTDAATGKQCISSDASVVFHRLPSSQVLTLTMDTPEAWVMGSHSTDLDLDNIKMGDTHTHSGTGDSADGGLQAVFKLKGFVAAGRVDNMDDALSGSSLSLALRSSVKGSSSGSGSAHSDATSAMFEPSPYYQLHGPPGAWSITARDMTPGKKKGKRMCLQREIDGAVSGGDGKGKNRMTPLSPSLPIAIYSFLPPPVNVRVEQCPPEAADAVAAVEAEEKSYAKAEKSAAKAAARRANSKALPLSSSLSGSQVVVAGGDAARKNRTGDTIHVFSIASGHLYERFLRIMILSITKNTDNPVTFWFLEDFLSPNFKITLPYLADKYGFQYRWVRYNWPDNLRKQSVKMRLVWAYKILFLDTMFPPSLDKIVFVDADQVVRADLKELWDHDMKGAPLAMTPFCNDRPETDGFRFWKSGFWASHLGSNSYHISALFIVDLKQMRQRKAGDHLRGTYQRLTGDPNSLANLDQDLPNYAQFQVPIHSLPQEWLWCETWCSDKIKTKAKTIDLCNNPLTKEPKLDGARRIVPEWTSLDEEGQQGEREALAVLHGDALPEPKVPLTPPTVKPAAEVEVEVEAKKEAKKKAKKEAKKAAAAPKKSKKKKAAATLTGKKKAAAAAKDKVYVPPADDEDGEDEL